MHWCSDVLTGFNQWAPSLFHLWHHWLSVCVAIDCKILLLTLIAIFFKSILSICLWITVDFYMSWLFHWHSILLVSFIYSGFYCLFFIKNFVILLLLIIYQIYHNYLHCVFTFQALEVLCWAVWWGPFLCSTSGFPQICAEQVKLLLLAYVNFLDLLFVKGW